MISSPRGADRAGIAGLVDDIRKRLDPLPVRPLIGRAGPFVERDQVDLGGNALDQLHQPPRVGVAVIHALQHDIFEGDPLAVRQPRIVAQGGQQRLDVPFLVDRHQRVAHRIGGGVEADGQQAADLLGGAGDLGHHARGGQGDAAARKGQPLAIHHDLHRVAHVLEVVERLAHAHQHDIGHQPRLILRRARHWPFAQVVARQHHLADDLARGQVAHQFLRAGMAERTSQRAADLAGNAQRPPRFLGDIDHLDLMPASDAHQVLAGAIRRHLLRHQFRDRHLEMGDQQGAVLLGKIGHPGEIAHAPVIDPLPDLPDAHLRLPLGRARRDQCVAHLLARQPDKVDRSALGQLARDRQHVLRDRRCGAQGGSLFGELVGHGGRASGGEDGPQYRIRGQNGTGPCKKARTVVRALCLQAAAAVSWRSAWLPRPLRR
ncbi:hypothetical protein AKL17_3109 [Frigidibacter mobilis]|uniref:Uncharacterized protein n=1 Tax=Frigidibacter mobilis TaxID=1335048 RepID=A0A159Z547_9RHOB|nr:hypothetical protein AKL17_3109 [Frigidibacter mobilis]